MDKYPPAAVVGAYIGGLVLVAVAAALAALYFQRRRRHCQQPKTTHEEAAVSRASTEVAATAPAEAQPLLSESAIRTRYVDSADEYARSFIDRTSSAGYATPQSLQWALSRSPYNPALNTVNVAAADSDDSDDSGFDSSDDEHSHTALGTALHSEPELGHTPSTPRASGNSTGSSIQHSPQPSTSAGRSLAADSAVCEQPETSIGAWSDQEESTSISSAAVQSHQEELISTSPVAAVQSAQNGSTPASPIVSKSGQDELTYNGPEAVQTAQSGSVPTSPVILNTDQDELTPFSRPRCSTLNAQAKVFVPHTQPRTAANSDADVNKPQDADTGNPQDTDSYKPEPQDAGTHPVTAKRRCRFWPACSNRNCKYVHPRQPCQAYPQCSFGTNCIYVHPTDMPKINGLISGKPTRRSKRKADIVKLNNLECYLPQPDPSSA
ncbi:hypothetical protein IWW50_002717 [Coemansia erecta]|nr:hypothetical protein IWW50_002717 [Coemansia erecta]